MTTKADVERPVIRKYVWKEMAKPSYRAEVIEALREHLGDAEKDGDGKRVEMYHAAILAMQALHADATRRSP